MLLRPEFIPIVCENGTSYIFQAAVKGSLSLINILTKINSSLTRKCTKQKLAWTMLLCPEQNRGKYIFWLHEYQYHCSNDDCNQFSTASGVFYFFASILLLFLLSGSVLVSSCRSVVNCSDIYISSCRSVFNCNDIYSYMSCLIGLKSLSWKYFMGRRTAFTHSAITLPKVKLFGWNLEQWEPNVGAVAGRYWAWSAQ